MATLSSLPTELLHRVISSLAPFDQLALSAISKSFDAIIKPRIRLDQISQHIYLSLILTTARPSISIFLLNHFAEVQSLLLKTYLSISSAHNLASYSSAQQELLQPYFPNKGFPQCTIAHHYFSTINTFAATVYESALGNDFGDLIGWACVKMDAQRFLQRLGSDLGEGEAVEGPALQLKI